MTTELTLTPELKDLEPSKAAQIEAVFAPMVDMLKGFETAYSEITAQEVTPETCKKAKRLRLDISKIRVSADKVRKEQKAEYLRAGNAIQGVYNILKFAVTDKEEKLKEIETHFERIEAERVEKLGAERLDILRQYTMDEPPMNLGELAEDVWKNYISGVKLNYEAIKEAERKAEEDRLAAIEAERVENERIRLENEKLRKEAEEREALRAKEEAARLKKERAAQAKIDAERKAQEEALRKEREAREKVEAEARRKEEARIQAEREAKAEADRLKAEQQEAERKAANAPDKEKLLIIAGNLLEKIEMFVSQEAKDAMRDAARILSNTAEDL